MSPSKLHWFTISALVVFTVILLFNAIPFLERTSPLALSIPSKADTFHAPRQNIWVELSEHEADDVIKFLSSRADLNLTRRAAAAGNGNGPVFLELLQPNKTDALLYLNGTSAPPQRWAHALLIQAMDGEVQLVDYMVGPLPVGPETKLLPLDFCYNSGRNYVSMPIFAAGFDLEVWGEEFGANVSDITMALLGGKVNNSDPDTLKIVGRPVSGGYDTASYWLSFIRQGWNSGAFSLMPQGLYFNIEISAEHPAGWKILRWYYNGIFYDTDSDLRAALADPNFERSPPNLDGDWTSSEGDFEGGPPGREKPAPAMVQPDGRRFNIDKNQRYISWMGFELFISVSQTTALALYDIRFNGESIIYELGLQEAMAHYAGDDPAQGGLEFLDSLFGLGARMFELVPGYDCPAYATFLSTSYHDGTTGEFVTNKNNICVFEYTADHALQRHTVDRRVSISRNTYLVIRSVSTMGNYDFTIDYIFYLDGTIEVKLRASGFIFGAFWSSNSTKKEDEYGYRVHDAVATSMHDHVLNFKADLDIAGTANTLMRVAIEPLTQDYPWDDEQAKPRHTMHLVEHEVDLETGIDWPGNSGEMYIVRTESKNIWGEKRGYRIAPGTGMGTPSHLTILNSTSLGKSAEWASQDLWVVKQKDNEPKSASPWNYFQPLDPLVDFSKFVDGEDVVEEDLVVYFNLGSHHVPHSGDIPNTLMHTSASSVMFTPFNFHDRDASRRSVQGVRLDLGANGPEPQFFGGRYTEDVHLKATDLEGDLSRYTTTKHDVTNLTLPFI